MHKRIQIEFESLNWLYTPCSALLLMKLFNNSSEIITVKLKPSLLLNASLHVYLLTFITEVHHLISIAK